MGMTVREEKGRRGEEEKGGRDQKPTCLGGVTYRYFPCLPASSALFHDLPDLFTTSDPFPVSHPLPDNFHDFHWLPPAPGSLLRLPCLPHASTPSRGAMAHASE